jgi:transcriptional regulator NrdR family protein
MAQFNQEAIPEPRIEQFKRAEAKVQATIRFASINHLFDQIKERKPKDDPNFESNYDNLEDTAIKRILELLEPNNAEKTSSESQETIMASLNEADTICKKRIKNLMEKFDTGEKLSIDEKNKMTLYNHLQESIKREMVSRRAQTTQTLKRAA